MTPEEFVRAAVRVPFADRGRDWDGWDCWGVVYRWFADVEGRPVPDYVDEYEDAGATRSSREHLAEVIDRERPTGWRRVDTPRQGDVVLIRLGGRPVHVGVMLDEHRFVHSEDRVGTMVESTRTRAWERRIEGFYRRE